VTLEVHLASDVYEKHLADKIVIEHHSYVASARTVGRVLKYLIFFENRIVGTFWIGSGFKPTPKDILNHFMVGQKEFDKIFNEVADNKRFAMMEQIPNLGSQILAKIRGRARRDWADRYGDYLRAIVTTIGANKNGAVYLADNWKRIGETAGLPSNRQSISMKWNNSEEIAARFVKPSGEDKKIILITESLKEKESDNSALF
jgi:hypothetical protein